MATTTTSATQTSQAPATAALAPLLSASSAGSVSQSLSEIARVCAGISADHHGQTRTIQGHDYFVYWGPNKAPATVARTVGSEVQQLRSISISASDSGASNLPILLVGGAQDEAIFANAPGAILCGGDGNDLLSGKGFDDILIGGPGADEIKGNGGNDLLLGDLEDIRLSDGAGNDWCSTVVRSGISIVDGSCENQFTLS